MDREIVNKAAEEYNKKLGKSRNVTWNDGEYGFIAGADWLMQQPLQERLTEEEKERIKGLYKDFEQLEIYGASLSDRAAGRNHCLLLTAIFGTDLFKEK